MPFSDTPPSKDSETDWSSSKSSAAQARATAQTARLAEFSAMLNQVQETAPDSLDLISQAFRLMLVSSTEDSWVAVSGTMRDLFTDEERAELVEEKIPVVIDAAAAAAVSAQSIRSGLLLEFKTLLHTHRGTQFGEFDFTREALDFENSLISLTAAIHAIRHKFAAFNKARFEQSSPSDDSSGPPGPPVLPNLNDAQRPLLETSSFVPSSFIPETAISSVNPNGRGRGKPLKVKSPVSSLANPDRNRSGPGQHAPSSSDF